VDNGDGTVTDSCSGLMWQKVQADIDGSGDFEPEADFATWEQANGFVKGLNIGGHSDWRLPTIQELEGILISDPAHLRAPAVDPLFAVYPVACWSSTPFQLQKAVPAYWTLAFGVSTAPAQPALSRGDTRKGVLAARGG
jgi:hypothetical protein